MSAPESLKIIYALVNPVVPGFVKIGCVSRCDVEKLHGFSGASAPSRCVYACEVGGADAEEVVRSLHAVLEEVRADFDRDLFYVESDRVVVALRSVSDALGGYELTDLIEKSIVSAYMSNECCL